MKAAIYARKSTDDNDRNEDNKSVKRQVERAKAFATARGWTVNDEHVYVDDGISGAEFKNRPALLRMLNRLKELDVIVMSELSRLGREQSQTSATLANIYSKGVCVFFYLTGEELRFKTATDKFMVSAVSFGAELEREKASQRSRDALERKAQKGYNAGGCVYGYSNHQVFATNAKGEPVRSHTEYRINEAEADTVRSIFRMYADGYGLDRVAKALNGDPRYRELSKQYFGGKQPPAPAAGRRGSGSWSPSSLHAMLRRERYLGVIPWGKHRKELDLANGTKKRDKQTEYLKIEAPHLRIVPPELWDRVQARLKAALHTYTKHTGGEPKRRHYASRESKFLLSGFVRCECCGASMIASSFVSGHPGKRQSIRCYVCSYYNGRGITVCDNRLRPRMAQVDTDVLDAIEQTVLTPAVTRAIIEGAYRRARELTRTRPDTSKTQRAELARAERELERYVALIATSNAAPAVLLAEIQKREAQVAALRQELAAQSELTDLTELDMRRVRKAVEDCAGRYKDTLRADIPGARAALRQLLTGPIWFKHGADGSYTLRGESRVGALLLPATSVKVASPRRFELLSPP
jgi:site-specific DNA recombinase